MHLEPQAPAASYRMKTKHDDAYSGRSETLLISHNHDTGTIHAKLQRNKQYLCSLLRKCLSEQETPQICQLGCLSWFKLFYNHWKVYSSYCNLLNTVIYKNNNEIASSATRLVAICDVLYMTCSNQSGKSLCEYKAPGTNMQSDCSQNLLMVCGNHHHV